MLTKAINIYSCTKIFSIQMYCMQNGQFHLMLLGWPYSRATAVSK